MRSGALRRWAAVLLWSTTIIAAAQTGGVAGHVFCADTQTPCRFASVVLQDAPAVKGGGTGAGSRGSSYSAQTDLDGAFQMRNVLPGDYYILARLAGYVSPYDLANSEYPDDSALRTQALEVALTRIKVEANQTAVADLTLSRGAALRGTARFDDGGVASGVALHLFRKNAGGKWLPYSNGAGSGRLSTLGFASRTNDRGAFYEPGLPPGTYTVAVTLPEVRLLPTGISGRQTLDVRASSGDALEVYRGDVFRLRDAAPVTLREGEERDGLDITIPTHGLHTLRGVVSAAAEGDRGLRGSVRLLDVDDQTTVRETPLQNDGTFVFNYVPTGRYTIAIDAHPARGDGPGFDPLSVPLEVEGDTSSLAYTVTPSKR